MKTILTVVALIALAAAGWLAGQPSGDPLKSIKEAVAKFGRI